MVVPAYNEADHIAATIAALPDLVDRIIVVDDASTDRTANVAHTLGDPRVIVIEHDHNAGVGGAMRTGYREALAQGYQFIGMIDADGQMRADELERLVEPLLLGIADYTKGNRFYLRGAAADMPAERSFGNTILSFMTKLASGYWHVFDSQCGYTVVRSAFLELIDLDTLPDDYFFENSLLIKLNALNARVVDVPITTLYGREVSGVSILRVTTTFPARLMLGGTAHLGLGCVQLDESDASQDRVGPQWIGPRHRTYRIRGHGVLERLRVGGLAAVCRLRGRVDARALDIAALVELPATRSVVRIRCANRMARIRRAPRSIAPPRHRSCGSWRRSDQCFMRCPPQRT